MNWFMLCPREVLDDKDNKYKQKLFPDVFTQQAVNHTNPQAKPTSHTLSPPYMLLWDNMPRVIQQSQKSLNKPTNGMRQDKRHFREKEVIFLEQSYNPKSLLGTACKALNQLINESLTDWLTVLADVWQSDALWLTFQVEAWWLALIN